MKPDGGRTRVLHVVANLNYGGMERLIYELARSANRTVIESHVLTLEPPGRFGRGLAEFATLREAPAMEPWSLLRPAVLARAIRAIAPDVVHTHSGMWYKASLAARMAGVRRVVHTEHGRGQPDPWLARLLDRRASRRTDVVIAVSAAVARQLEAGVVADRSRVRVVPNGVDPEVFRPARDDRLRAELGIAPAVPILGSIGRLEPIKGYDLMIEAYAILCGRWGGPAPVLVIAGDGSQARSLAALAEARGIREGVHLLGWRDDVHALHGAFTLFTMSSHSEGTSVSLLEAMSASLCPVVTNVGGNAAVLGPELAHRLMPSGDPSGLADGWAEALRDSERLIADARTARSRILEAFTLRSMVDAYEAIYREASARSGTGRR